MNNFIVLIVRPRIVHGVVRPVLGGFFAPHLQGQFSLITNRTSLVKGWEPFYTRCGAPFQFGAVNLVKKKKPYHRLNNPHD